MCSLTAYRLGKVASNDHAHAPVSCSPVRHVVPEHEQQRTLKQKAISVLQLRQAVADALQCEVHKHLLEVRLLRLGNVEQADANGGCDLAHSIASRNGRITFVT